MPGSSVHGILQARILELVTIPFYRDLSKPRIEPRSPALQVDFIPSEPPGKPTQVVQVLKQRDGSLRGKSSIYGTNKRH